GPRGFAVAGAGGARVGHPLVGVVPDPTTGIVRHAIRGGGAYRNGEAWMRPTPHSATPLMVFADRSFLAHPSADQTMIDLEQVAGDLGRPGVRVETGAGAVMNACQVLDHSPACYLKLPVARGGGSLWDFAATACLFHELGAVATDSGGRALDLNRRERTSMGHRGVLFASDADLASRLRTITPRS
ncbi:MAG: inositol monophosphatase family protein, partial [Actinomycetota bacterium]